MGVGLLNTVLITGRSPINYFSFIFVLGLAYLSGSIPWSVWVSQYLVHQDPRSTGDGNPGAANAFKVAGRRAGVFVLLLDFLKGALPVLLTRWLWDLDTERLMLIALAPSVGHSFSIFLGLRGGRGLATLFGVWTGLTLYELPIIMGVTALVSLRTINNDELKSVSIPLIALIYLIATGKPGWMIALLMLQLLLLLGKIWHFYFWSAARSSANERGHDANNGQ